ncbi:MAG: hypothetical protein OEV42_19530 [Deltaproteobacteria bacterium]|nr:hypothetical protein [Deltaproteobacteria bacterium]
MTDENGVDEQAEPRIAEPRIDAAQVEVALQSLMDEENFAMAAVAGLIGAIVSAVIWAGITVATGYQIGIVAIAVGFIVATVVRISGKGLTPKFSILGAVLALVGCVLGNFFTLVYFGAQESGITIMELLPLINVAQIPALMIDTFSGMDLVFYGIAVYEGYQLSLRKITGEDMA